MPSMSYCAFENTAVDMQQCVNMMHEAAEEGLSLAQFLRERGQYEAPAVRRLVQQATDLLECYEILNSNKGINDKDVGGEDDPEETGPDHAHNWTDTAAELD